MGDEIVPILKAAPGLRAIAVLAEIRRRHPEIGPGIRRTLERRMRAWWRPPDRNRMWCSDRSTRLAVSLSDFTDTKVLGVMIAASCRFPDADIPAPLPTSAVPYRSIEPVQPFLSF